jgi:hypothetical protein
MGIFQNFVGAVKQGGSLVIGAVKRTAQSVGDTSRHYGVGDTMQTVGSFGALLGAGLTATGVGAVAGAPLIAASEAVIGGGMAMKAVENLTDRSKTVNQRLGNMAIDTVGSIALSHVAGALGRRVGQAGIRAGLKTGATVGANVATVGTQIVGGAVLANTRRALNQS